MTDILGSRFTMWEQYILASGVVELVQRQIKSEISPPTYSTAAWIPPLLGLLQLGEENRWGFSRAAGVFAIQVFSCIEDFSPTILPILTSTLRHTHPLQCRKTALRIFHQFHFGLLSSQMESISSEDRASLLQAVGDPFQDTEEEHAIEHKYNPMSVAIILIEFASSDLWRNHLRHSNFVTCEEVTSTETGRQSVYEYMLLRTELWPFLHTPMKIISAIERLEVLQCPNTLGAVFASVWGFAAFDRPSVDLDGWRVVRQKTLAFYKTHRIGQLKVLPLEIAANTVTNLYHSGRPCRVEGVRLPIRIRQWWGLGEDWRGIARLAQVFQWMSFYQLFGCSPTEWDEMFADHSERVDEGVDVSVGRSRVPAQFVDCACDYP